MFGMLTQVPVTTIKAAMLLQVCHQYLRHCPQALEYTFTYTAGRAHQVTFYSNICISRNVSPICVRTLSTSLDFSKPVHATQYCSLYSLVIRDMLVQGAKVCQIDASWRLGCPERCNAICAQLLCSCRHIKHSPTPTCWQSCLPICYAFALTEGCACCSGTWDCTFKASDTQ